MTERANGSSRRPTHRIRDAALAQGVALGRQAEQITVGARGLWRDVTHVTQHMAHDERWHVVTDEVKERIRKPWVGATMAGAAVLVAGATWGVGEAAIAAIAAYAVFRMLRERGEPEDEPGVDPE
jgi:hypothetical protein